MAQVQGGYTFTGTAPSNLVTAATLNALIGSATALPGFITEQTAETTPADDDVFLMYDASATALRKITKGNFVGTPVGMAGTRGLYALGDASTVTITADEVVLRQSGGSNAKLHQAVSLTCTLATYTAGSTANGRDHSTVAASGWLYLWLISNGTTCASLLSDSATAPVLPSGYTYQALCGAIYQAASSMRVTLISDDRRCVCIPVTSGSLTTASLNNDPVATTNYQTLSLATKVPPSARRVRGYVSTVATSPSRIILAANNTGLGAVALWADTTSSSGAGDLNATETTSMAFEVPILGASQNIFWKHSVNHARQIWTTGFDL